MYVCRALLKSSSFLLMQFSLLIKFKKMVAFAADVLSDKFSWFLSSRDSVSREYNIATKVASFIGNVYTSFE